MMLCLSLANMEFPNKDVNTINLQLQQSKVVQLSTTVPTVKEIQFSRTTVPM